ncbi:class I SAM-dependent methyltransferase, partial [Endomicrobium sp. AH-315-J14]|nr:class I SAM-dependent methyltransferase [Endomicrobium sp. AH-315-J14]
MAASIQSPPLKRDHLAVALASGAAITLQLALTRLLSITLWHHFAFLVVGLALLGFGTAGSFLARRGLLARGDRTLHDALSRRALLAAGATLASLTLALSLRPNPLALFRDPETAITLALMALLATLPFLGAGLVIGTAISGWSARAGKVYAADLIGGGLAAALVVPTISSLGALGLCALAISMLALSAMLFGLSTAHHRGHALAATLVVVSAFGVFQDEDAWVVPAPSKELARVHRPSEGKHWVEHRIWTPHGRIDVSHRFPGIPLLAGDIHGIHPWWIRIVTQDGAAPTTIHEISEDPGELTFLRHATTAAVWVMRGATLGIERKLSFRKRPRALVIGAGGGIDVMMAVAYGAHRVIGVDVNPAILDLTRKRFRDF